MNPHIQAGMGILAILAMAWLFSEDRRRFPWRIVGAGLLLQLALALLLLKVPAARAALLSLNTVVDAITAATKAGTSFVFGYVGGAAAPFAITNPTGMVSFAFSILPMVIVISALASLLWYWRVLQVVVSGFAFVLRKVLGIGGAVGLGATATVFLGMVEAPLLIRPYLDRLSRSELFVLLTVGLATVAGTVFVLYATILSSAVPGALGHILVASMLSLPGAIVIAKIMIPGAQDDLEAAGEPDFPYRSSMDAISRGTEDGLKLWLNIVAMLLVMVALVALANSILAAFPAVDGAPLTLQRIFGVVLAPATWLIGIPADQVRTAGALLGEKIVLNELIAYIDLARLPAAALDPRSRLIMVYAMCGFANFGSVGIMIGGMSALIPERRKEVAELALRALFSGALASAMTGAWIGLLPIS